MYLTQDLTHGVGSIRNKSEVWSRLECVTAEEGRLECVTAEEGRLECVTAEEGDSSTEKYQTMILVPKEVSFPTPSLKRKPVYEVT